MKHCWRGSALTAHASSMGRSRESHRWLPALLPRPPTFALATAARARSCRHGPSALRTSSSSCALTATVTRATAVALASPIVEPRSASDDRHHNADRRNLAPRHRPAQTRQDMSAAACPRPYVHLVDMACGRGGVPAGHLAKTIGESDATAREQRLHRYRCLHSSSSEMLHGSTTPDATASGVYRHVTPI